MTKKLSIAERRAKLEEEAKRLAIAEFLREKADSLIEQLRDNIQDEYMDYTVVGHEEAQKMEDGELLWKIPYKWRPVKDSELESLTEEERAKAEPYHEPIWDYVEKREEELSEDDKNKIMAYSVLIKILEEADY